jgi:integrase
LGTIEKVKRKGGKTAYRVDIKLAGYPRQKQTFDKINDARAWASTTETAIREGRMDPLLNAMKHTVGEAIDRYNREVLPHKSKKKRHLAIQKKQLEWWGQVLGDHLLQDARVEVINEAWEKLAVGRKKRLTGATYNRYRAALSHVFTVAVDTWRWMPENPVLLVEKKEEAPGRTRFLSEDEVERFLDACMQEENHPYFLIVLLLLSSGARKNEVMSLRWDNIVFQEGRALGVIQNQLTKNKEDKTLLFVGPAYHELVYYASLHRKYGGLLFPSRLRHDHPADIYYLHRKACARAKIKNFRIHDQRHTFASYVAIEGGTGMQVMKALGQKNEKMALRYAHLNTLDNLKLIEAATQKMLAEVPTENFQQWRERYV